jgi:hypothetical protein
MYSTISTFVPAFKVADKIKKFTSNKDSKHGQKHSPALKQVLQRDPLTGSTMKQNIYGLLSLLLFVGAIYLSWTCNTKCSPNMNAFEKAIRAIFAGLFYIIYYIFYFVAWSQQCNAC